MRYLRYERVNLHPLLKHIFHFHQQAGIHRANGKRGTSKLWRAHADGWIARKGKTFFGNEDGQVHFVIAVFIMDDGNRIGARRDTRETDIGGIACRNNALDRIRILAAIRKRFWVFGQTDHQLALYITKAAHVQANINPAACGKSAAHA